MPTSIKCPECRAVLKVPDSFLGKTLRCKHCGEEFRAKPPAPDDEDEPRPERSRARRHEDEDEDDRPARKPGKKSGKKKSSLPFVLGVCAALLPAAGAIGVVLWTQGVFSRSTEPGNKTNAGPIPRKDDESEDYSEHVRIRLGKVTHVEVDGGTVVGAEIEVEFLKPQKLPNMYYVASERPSGKPSKVQLNPDRVPNGKGKLGFTFKMRPDTDVKYKYWIAKRKFGGSPDDLVRVSNVITIPE